MNIEAILQRLNKLYEDLPIEYAVYVLDAIEDIERILHEQE